LAVTPEAAAIVAVGNDSGNFTLQYTVSEASVFVEHVFGIDG
jgi:hypothetical protein